jgi:hypothetical protein
MGGQADTNVCTHKGSEMMMPFLLFLQKQKRAFGYIPVLRVLPLRKSEREGEGGTEGEREGGREGGRERGREGERERGGERDTNTNTMCVLPQMCSSMPCYTILPARVCSWTSPRQPPDPPDLVQGTFKGRHRPGRP